MKEEKYCVEVAERIAGKKIAEYKLADSDIAKIYARFEGNEKWYSIYVRLNEDEYHPKQPYDCEKGDAVYKYEMIDQYVLTLEDGKCTILVNAAA